MLIYRSFVVGLLGAIALLLAGQGAALDRLAEHSAEPAAVIAPDARAVREIVHVSRSGAGEDPSPALGLGAGEVPYAIDDREITGYWRDAVRDYWAQVRAGHYFTLWLRPLGSGTPSRHMLVLVTP